MANKVKINVEHCGMCRAHGHKCRELQKYIMKMQPDTDVKCRIGRRGSFEVVVNGKLVHSKLQTLTFPEEEAILQSVQNVQEGISPEYATTNRICNIM